MKISQADETPFNRTARKLWQHMVTVAGEEESQLLAEESIISAYLTIFSSPFKIFFLCRSFILFLTSSSPAQLRFPMIPPEEEPSQMVLVPHSVDSWRPCRSDVLLSDPIVNTVPAIVKLQWMQMSSPYYLPIGLQNYCTTHSHWRRLIIAPKGQQVIQASWVDGRTKSTNRWLSNNDNDLWQFVVCDFVKKRHHSFIRVTPVVKSELLLHMRRQEEEEDGAGSRCNNIMCFYAKHHHHRAAGAAVERAAILHAF